MKIKVSNVILSELERGDCEISRILKSWRSCLKSHITFGGLGIIEATELFRDLDPALWKKLVITQYFCWKE